MSLEKRLESLTESDLQDLIVNGVSERRDIDYKEQLPGNADGDKKEFLADVSSFANAMGGHLVYGMREDDGLPIALAGVEATNADAQRLRLENVIREGIAPRIPGVQIGEPICLNTGKVALVIRVPQSWISPHMVTYKGHSRFYSRNSAGKYPLDVQELRAAFLFSEAAGDRLRDFRAERLSKIIAGMTPVRLRPGLRILLHVIPLSALHIRQRFDAASLARIHLSGSLQPVYSSSAYSARYNFDGYLVYDQSDDSSPAASYLQLFRNGVFESVNTLVDPLPNASKRIPSFELEGKLLQALPGYFIALKSLGVGPPIFLALSLIGVSGYSMEVPPPAAFSFVYPDGGRIDSDSLFLPEVMAERSECDFGEVLKPAFDAIWNAAGWEGSIYYEGSKWTGVAKFLPKRS